MYIADLHIHSHYSRATSKDCTPEYLDLWARRKGIGIIGSGDFTHPAWRQELTEKLEQTSSGFYVLKKEYRIEDPLALDHIQPHFVITGEISSIYKKYDRVRKVHSLLILPGLLDAEKLSHKLEAIGNIQSDGRPILGLDCHDLLEILLTVCPEAVYVPAHIWTPHFSLFGAFSGFDSVEECYGDLASHIHAVETGLSSDPPMNWRVSALDRFQLISNSDAHSPAKLGREANLLDIPLSYTHLTKAIQTGEGLAGTIEFFPEEGKYHYDGHRKCGICLSPLETNQYGGVCPVCKRKLTIGVSHRVEQLADRPLDYQKEHAAHFESLVPLPEIIGASVGYSSASRKVERTYHTMLQKLGPEFTILRDIPFEEIRSVSGILIAEGIERLRKGEVTRLPGFDGEYGTIRLFTQGELDQLDGQLSLFPMQPASDTHGLSNKAEGYLLQQPGIDNLDKKQQTVIQSEQATIENNQTAIQSKQLAIQSEQATIKSSRQQEVAWNERQRKAIESFERVTAVTAGPGTGKTGTLAAHILHLIEMRRVKPSCITAVTFTNLAAKQMRERIQKQLGKGTAAKKLQIGSFHAIAWKTIKDQGIEATLAGDMETRDLASKLIKQYSLDMTAAQFLTKLSNYKTGLCQNAADIQPELLEAFSAYQTYCKEWKLLDFDDLLLEALRIAKEQADDSKKNASAKQFSYLMVDEFQDISPLQYELMKAWNQGGKELFVIGDRDQAIYSFRGADAACFEKLLQDFPQTCQITLTENYRSTPQILEVAKEVISKNPGGIRCLQPHMPKGAKVRMIEAASEMKEAVFIAKEINRLTGGIGMLEAHELSAQAFEGELGFDDIAVLYRTHRQAEFLETCLKKEGIPYVVAGRDTFLLEQAVRGTISFFQSLIQPDDHLAVQTAENLLWDVPKGEMSSCIYENLAEKYTPYLKRKKPQKILEQWMQELRLEQKKGMKKLLQMAVFYQTMPEFIEALKLGVESDLKRCGDKRYTSGAVTLMTLHGAKGLEFPAVLIYGTSKGLIPFGKDFEKENDCLYQEEERRLFYVGITRAKKTLVLTCTKEHSAYLDELPDGLLQKEKAPVSRNTGNGRQLSLFDFLD